MTSVASAVVVLVDDVCLHADDVADDVFMEVAVLIVTMLTLFLGCWSHHRWCRLVLMSVLLLLWLFSLAFMVLSSSLRCRSVS